MKPTKNNQTFTKYTLLIFQFLKLKTECINNTNFKNIGWETKMSIDNSWVEFYGCEYIFSVVTLFWFKMKFLFLYCHFKKITDK